MTRFTAEQLERLAHIAGAIALEAPINHAPWSLGTAIPWPLIEKARDVLTEAGVDWRKLAKRVKAEQLARKIDRDASIRRRFIESRPLTDAEAREEQI